MLRGLRASWHVERIGYEHFTDARCGDGFLIAIWHGDMLAPLPLHTRMGISVLVSPSGDGALVKMVLERFGYRVIRGSSNRGSARALREMRAHLRDHGAVVITPDGPRGPRHSMNLGLGWLARETGCPIVSIRVECDRAWHLRSWDHFAVPKPRARIRLHYTAALHVPPDADDAALEVVTERIRQNLLGG
ncbi:MAG: lysophospholipid acyltransferase family protein [Planctomycetes bacterium]|nr:lysophospholipid acyltransferase family protein [Planctomycetota bacterium]MCB9869344.1 lysophospholipid acyltransferase family protein [Planctomycetota bacterium]